MTRPEGEGSPQGWVTERWKPLKAAKQVGLKCNARVDRLSRAIKKAWLAAHAELSGVARSVHLGVSYHTCVLAVPDADHKKYSWYVRSRLDGVHGSCRCSVSVSFMTLQGDLPCRRQPTTPLAGPLPTISLTLTLGEEHHEEHVNDATHISCAPLSAIANGL